MIALRVVVVAAMVAAVWAQQTGAPAEILTESSLVRGDGYDFAFKTSDGVSRQEQAHLINVGQHQGIAVQGSYSYSAPDGQTYLVSFTADDKGYQPTIRVAPPVQ